MKIDNPAESNKLTPGRLLRIKQFIPRFLPMAESTFWRKVSTGEYPQPVKLSGRITCWKSEDILALMDRPSQEMSHAA